MLIRRLRQIAKRDNFWSKTISYFITLLGEPIFQSIFNIITGAVIAIFINCITASTPSIKTIKEFIIVFVLTAIIQVTMIAINKERHLGDSLAKWYEESTEDVGNINGYISYRLSELSGKIQSGNILQMDSVISTIGFQKIAVIVCDRIYSIISKSFGCHDVSVMIFQRFDYEDGLRKCLQLITCSNEKNREPPYPYGKDYLINSSSREKKFAFQTVFENHSKDIVALSNKQEIQKYFKIKSSKRNNDDKKILKQYIGIPASFGGEKIFLLQIEVYEDNVLGNTIEDMKILADNVLFLYTNLLTASYVIENTVRTLYSCILANQEKLQIPYK